MFYKKRMLVLLQTNDNSNKINIQFYGNGLSWCSLFLALRCCLAFVGGCNPGIALAFFSLRRIRRRICQHNDSFVEIPVTTSGHSVLPNRLGVISAHYRVGRMIGCVFSQKEKTALNREGRKEVVC